MKPASTLSWMALLAATTLGPNAMAGTVRANVRGRVPLAEGEEYRLVVHSYDAKNAKAISSLVAKGTQISVLPPAIIKALRTALEEVLDEEAAKNEQFKRILASWRPFRNEQHRWFSLADARTEMAVYTQSQ